MLPHQGFFVFYMENILRLIGNLIIVLWLVLLVLLAIQHFNIPGKPMPRPAAVLTEIAGSEQWSGIFFKGKKIGYTHALRQKTDNGYLLTKQAVMQVAMMGMPQRIVTTLSAETDRNFQLRTFTFNIKTGILNFMASGTITGTTLRIKSGTGGALHEASINLAAVPALDDSLKWSLVRDGLRVGQKTAQSVFDPLTMTAKQVTAEVEAVEEIVLQGSRTVCFRVRHTYNGLMVYSWLNQEGETVKEESPLGFVLQQESAAAALQGIADRALVDIIAETSVPVNSPITKHQLAYLKIRLRNVSLEGFTLDGARQKRNGDIVEIYREQVTGVDTFHIPVRTPGLKQYLAASPYVQSDDPTIVNASRTILKDESDAQQAARMLCAWVYQTIEKKPTLSIPRAADVLRLQRGDCNEHAVLFAALCRAAGIPAKTCAGVVYHEGRFYYHAWTEIYLQRWIAVDPAMNQFPADATHIKFVEGELDHFLLLLNIAGKLAIDVLDYS